MTKIDWMELSGAEAKIEGERWKEAMQQMIDQKVIEIKAEQARSMRYLGRPILTLILKETTS